MILALVLVAIIVASSLVLYENSVLNPAGSSGSWQRPLENFATGLAADNSKVYVMDINGDLYAFSTQTVLLSGTQMQK